MRKLVNYCFLFLILGVNSCTYEKKFPEDEMKSTYTPAQRLDNTTVVGNSFWVCTKYDNNPVPYGFFIVNFSGTEFKSYNYSNSTAGLDENNREVSSGFDIDNETLRIKVYNSEKKDFNTFSFQILKLQVTKLKLKNLENNKIYEFEKKRHNLDDFKEYEGKEKFISDLIFGEVYSIDTLKVGNSFQGGIIGYIFNKSDKGYVPHETHGIIYAKSFFTNVWLENYVSLKSNISNEYPENIGFGSINSTKILTKINNANSAVKLCLDYVDDSEGYTDWFLGASREYEVVLNSVNFDFGNETIKHFWTSSLNSYYDFKLRYVYVNWPYPGYTTMTNVNQSEITNEKKIILPLRYF